MVNDDAFSGSEYYHLFQVAEKGNPERIIEGYGGNRKSPYRRLV